MTNGIKTEGGTSLAKPSSLQKTIFMLFLSKSVSIKIIQYSGKFLRVIDNYDPKAQDSLEVFCDEKRA
jgi:type I restriction enzyme R subunit